MYSNTDVNDRLGCASVSVLTDTATDIDLIDDITWTQSLHTGMYRYLL
jgi:hypothetical protein